MMMTLKTYYLHECFLTFINLLTGKHSKDIQISQNEKLLTILYLTKQIQVDKKYNKLHSIAQILPLFVICSIFHALTF